MMPSFWTRRTWLASNTVALAAMTPVRQALGPRRPTPRGSLLDPAGAAGAATHAVRIEPGPLQALTQRAIDAARAAGATYADARLTRTVGHVYQWHSGLRLFAADTEVQGMGVRALVDGYWGFAAACFWDADAVVRLAQDAVTQARVNATVSTAGTSPGGLARRVVDLAPVPAVTGTWATPIEIDPFTISVEEKLDHILSWEDLINSAGAFFNPPLKSSLTFARQECVLATTDGTLVTQTTYETGGVTKMQGGDPRKPIFTQLEGLETAARGWELVLAAKIHEQLALLETQMLDIKKRKLGKPPSVGRYTVVCDGATMAALVAETLGPATQLDRALGYEANATGSSFISDPLGMVGNFQLAAPLVTITANRSAPTQLATVKWDAEGVVPDETTLVTEGVLTDFQTTREQAAWLAPYYAKTGKPVRSHGHAAAEDALVTSLQMLPNVALAPSPEAVRQEDLIANVREGFLVTGGSVETDSQAGSGVLWPGEMREIKNGRLGAWISTMAVQFNTLDFWKNVIALGGATTTGTVARGSDAFIQGGHGTAKGEPAQGTSYTAQAVAATILDQPLVDPRRKA